MSEDHLLQNIKKGIAHLKKDRDLAHLIDLHAIWEPETPVSYFQSLVVQIINQQLSSKAADSIYNRFISFFADKFPEPQELLKIDSGILRGSGLSRSKISFIKDAASKIINKQVSLDSLKKADETKIRGELMKIKGVGPWTADMMLMFSYHHLDILPLGDLGIRKAIMKLLSTEKFDEEKAVERSLKWKPYRTVASIYLWKSL